MTAATSGLRQLVVNSDAGLHCEAGGFFVDPVRPVRCAVLTHAHGDHALPGCDEYHVTTQSAGLLRTRLGRWTVLRTHDYGEPFQLGEVTVSLHPAGHILGSAQVRLRRDEAVWCITGDFKRQPDPSCTPYEVVRCDTLVTESTFANPRYAWPDVDTVIEELVTWWNAVAAEGGNAVVLCYALGKAQRLLAELAGGAPGPIVVHPNTVRYNEAYAAAGIALAPWLPWSRLRRGAGALVLAPPSSRVRRALRSVGAAQFAVASGWVVDGLDDGIDRGFVLSDHVDWSGLLRTIEESGAGQVLTVHGDGGALAEALSPVGVPVRSLS